VAAAVEGIAFMAEVKQQNLLRRVDHQQPGGITMAHFFFP